MREDFQELIDEVSTLLGTPATLESRSFALLAFAAHEREDATALDPVRTRSILHRRSTAAVRAYFEGFGITRARRPVRIPPEPAAGVLTGRLCLPVRHGGVVYGYIWLLDEGALPLTDPRLADAQDAAERIGTLLAQESRSGARRSELLRALLRAAPGGQREVAAERLAAALGPTATEPLALVALTPWEAADDGAPGGLPHVEARCAMPAADGASAEAVLVRLRSAASTAPARSAAHRIRAAAPEPRPTAGLAAPRRALAELPAAWGEARAAARAAAARGAALAEWGELGPYRLLATLPAGEPDPAVRALLRPEHRELAHTAETYLDQAGQASRASAALAIHRQTLYYRLSRIERLTGLDLGDGEDRLLLHMALKVARLPAPGEGPPPAGEDAGAVAPD